MWVRLGNVAPVEHLNDPGNDKPPVRRAIALGKGEDHRETVVVFPEGYTVRDAFADLTRPGGVWASHSDADPAWVMSDSDGLAALLAEQFPGCTTRKARKGDHPPVASLPSSTE